MPESSSQVTVTWDLDRIFTGASASSAFGTFLADVEKDVADFGASLEANPEGGARVLTSLLPRVSDLAARVHEAGSFVACLMAQDDRDEGAKALSSRVSVIDGEWQAFLTRFDGLLVALGEDDLKDVLGKAEASGASFFVSERRAFAKKKLDPAREALISRLMVDGYHGWQDLRDRVVARMGIPIEEDGKTVVLSVSQAENRLSELHTAGERHRAFEAWEAAWGKEAELIATALNRLGGFRLAVYRERGWNDVLGEPLSRNRMQRATLETMWGVIEARKETLVHYLDRKARLLGLTKLGWTDIGATIGAFRSSVSLDEAREFVISKFSSFSPDMGDFAREAFTHHWVEAEDRTGKRPGAFCTSFPLEGETRIFMTFSGTERNLFTLAHELGHGYHARMLREKPYLSRSYPMSLAECASTFAERLVRDAALRSSGSDAETLSLLDGQAEEAVVMLMNIHARFLFEEAFYHARRQSELSPDELSSLMEEAQKKAFHGALASYHPLFWASKLHFYLTAQPFYNFPYTFGYLFTAGLYGRAREEGKAFSRHYQALLRDTGSMGTEELARKHLGVDLTRPSFWEEASDVALSDVTAFLALID